MADKSDDVKSLMSRFENLNKSVQTTGDAVRSRRGYTNGPSGGQSSNSAPPQKSTIVNLNASQKPAQPTQPAQSGLMQSQKKAAQPAPAPVKTTSTPPAKQPTNNLMTSTKATSAPAPQPKPTNLMASQPKQATQPPSQPVAKSDSGNNVNNQPKQTPAPAQPKPAQTQAPLQAPPQAQSPTPKRATFADEDEDDDDVQLRKKPLNKPKADPNRKSLAAPLVPLNLNRPPPPEDFEMPLSNYNTNTSTSSEPSKPQLKSTSSSNNLNFEIGDKWKIEYDDLEFDQLVSSGSAGEVYLGYYFGTPVAIKKLFSLPPDQKHLVAREFSMLQSLNHPNIVQFLGICDHSSGIYLITEYVEHGDLFDLLIFSDKEVSWKSKVKIALQIAYAVYYLHSKNIIHRDLKSQNVLIGENFKVKLCDLGLATVLEQKKRMTVCGTDEWMAPEIVVSETYDNKVDIFSFGIVLTEMISNQPPKKRGFAEKFQFNVEAFRNSIPEGCPDDLAQLVIDCTKFEPKQRPTFKEIVPRLKKLLDNMED